MNLKYFATSVFLLFLVVKASPTAKQILKLIPKAVVGGTVSFVGLHAGPCLKHQEKNDKSLNYWYNVLSKCARRDLLLKYGLVPKFVIDGRYDSSGMTVLLSALSDMDVDLFVQLLEAGADPNVAGLGDVDLFSFLSNNWYPHAIFEASINHGLDINRRNYRNRLPLDRIMDSARHYEIPTLLVKHGAKSDLSWSDLIFVNRRFNAQLPTKPEDLLSSQLHLYHRFIIEIYRASGRDKTIFSKVRSALFCNLQFDNDWHFFANIEKYDQMLATAEAEAATDKKQS